MSSPTQGKRLKREVIHLERLWDEVNPPSADADAAERNDAQATFRASVTFMLGTATSRHDTDVIVRSLAQQIRSKMSIGDARLGGGGRGARAARGAKHKVAAGMARLCGDDGAHGLELQGRLRGGLGGGLRSRLHHVIGKNLVGRIEERDEVRVIQHLGHRAVGDAVHEARDLKGQRRVDLSEVLIGLLLLRLVAQDDKTAVAPTGSGLGMGRVDEVG